MKKNENIDPNDMNGAWDFVKYIKPNVSIKNIEVGDFSYFNGEDFYRDCVKYHHSFSRDKLIIGKFCSISKGVSFIMNDANHPTNCITGYPFKYVGNWENLCEVEKSVQNKGNTIIGSDVWIGEKATIMPGVKIGNGAIIASNSVVTKDVSAYTVVAGNPATYKKQRFEDEIIDKLESLMWWNLDINVINKIIPLLLDEKIDEAIERIKEITSE